MWATTTEAEECVQARFGARLRHWRVRAELTQARLASTLRYSPALISKLESGTRRVTIAFARSADELLGANGDLVELAVQVALDGRTEPEALPAGKPHEDDPVPLPACAPRGPDVTVPDLRQVTSLSGLLCPLHGEAHDGRLDPDLMREAASAPSTAGVHAYLAWLAVYDQPGLDVDRDVLRQIECMLAVIVERAGTARPAERTALLHVAADYAAVAGVIRLNTGQSAAATVLLSQAVSWGAATGNVSARCRALCVMSRGSLWEGDTDSSARYASASQCVDPDRRWTVAHGHLWSAKAAAARGDKDGFERFIAAYQGLVDRFGDRDRQEAPWMMGEDGDIYTRSAIAGGLRDLASRTGSRAIAARAASATRLALNRLPPAMGSTYLLLAVRYADCLARAGHPDAISLTASAVASARINGTRPVQQELQSLDAALASVAAHQGASHR